MMITRALAGLALTTAFLAAAPLAAQAAPAAPWGPYSAPGGKAKAVGTLQADGEDHADIPTADVVRISGKVYDQTRSSSTCGWAVFRITYRDADGGLPFTHRSFRDCSYGTPLPFSFTRRDVYQVELKVCAEGRASKPSLTCLYAGTWKTIYLSK
ncbi:hypothetical protein [Microtetraspora niveoalba]|uniref:hypothetical protein n=1 Tax=Microtetraspora niveoalba TaxID=46175 RepID=UPI00082AB327|nr:hypothetical protein [Microtetraspora niveoalba]